MYVLAHHLFDVVAGSIIAYSIDQVATYTGYGLYDMKWWYPLSSTMLLAIYVQLYMRNKPKNA